MINSIVSTLLSNLKQHPEHEQNLPYSVYVREFRTIGLTLPRRSGKTKFLLSYHAQKSSRLFFHNYLMTSYVGLNWCDSVSTFGAFSRLGYDSKIVGTGAKYECFLLDEYNFMTANQSFEFNDMIDRYNSHNLLSKDFYVLKLTT